jgi:hypothetical protein
MGSTLGGRSRRRVATRVARQVNDWKGMVAGARKEAGMPRTVAQSALNTAGLVEEYYSPMPAPQSVELRISAL